jgi:hypothetical protein
MQVSVCPSCGDPFPIGGVCVACQETGEHIPLGVDSGEFEDTNAVCGDCFGPLSDDGTCEVCLEAAVYPDKYAQTLAAVDRARARVLAALMARWA